MVLMLPGNEDSEGPDRRTISSSDGKTSKAAPGEAADT